MPGRREARALVLLLCGLLCGACQERVAGTSTSVGNSLEGLAVLSDGSPAAGASVAARSGDILIAGGRPQSRLLAATVADSQGHFRLPLSPRADFYLEISGCARDSCSNSDFPEAFFRHYAAGSAGSDLGRLAMAPSGILRGILVDTLGRPFIPWIGIRGTDHFVRGVTIPGDPGQGAFMLTAPYPADYGLTVVYAMLGVINMVNPQSLPVDTTLVVQPGRISELGFIRLP